MTQSTALRLIKTEGRRTTIPTATEFEIAVREYLAALRQAGREISTIEKYAYHLGRLSVWLYERGITRPEQVSKTLLREWGADLHNEWAPATVKQATSVIRTFFSWCRDEEIVDQTLSSALRVPKTKQRVQRTLTSDEVQALLDVCDLNTTMGKRNAAIIAFMYDTGFRNTETCRARLGNLYFNVPMWDVRVNFLTVQVKGGAERYGYFEEETADYLRSWIEARRARPGVDTLFISLRGNSPGFPLTRFGLRDIFQRLGDKAGVEKATPHSMRRGFACALDDAGASSTTIMKLGRWSDVKLVELYTRAREPGKQYSQFSPMKRLRQSRE